MHIPEWSLADRLRKIRRESRMSQEDFSATLGIKSTTWAAWESGRQQPSRVLELADAIEREFDVPAAWTLGVMRDQPRMRTNTGEIPAQRQSVPPTHPLRRSTDLLLVG
jgi:transcriptional regulator with XRE-family HTH domain